jgi:hypothetical protein
MILLLSEFSLISYNRKKKEKERGASLSISRWQQNIPVPVQATRQAEMPVH